MNLFWKPADGSGPAQRLTQSEYSEGPASWKSSRPFGSPPWLLRLLLVGQYHGGNAWGRNYDIAPDGQRFVMLNTSAQVSPPTRINVVLNWFKNSSASSPHGSEMIGETMSHYKILRLDNQTTWL